MDTAAESVDQVKEFENLILFSHRFNSLLKNSTVFEGAGLSIASFSLLSVVAAEAGVPVHKAFLKAAITDKDEQKSMRQDLTAEGLVVEKSIGGGRKGLEITDKGLAAVERVRAELLEAVGKAEVKSWKAVPRLASIVRTLRPVLTAPEAAADPS